MPPLELPVDDKDSHTLTMEAMRDYWGINPLSEAPVGGEGDKAESAQETRKEVEEICYSGKIAEGGDLTVFSENSIRLDVICSGEYGTKDSIPVTLASKDGQFRLPFVEDVHLTLENGEPVIVRGETGEVRKLEKLQGAYDLMSVAAEWNLTPVEIRK